jgi:CHASE3 domain sensor protein
VVGTTLSDLAKTLSSSIRQIIVDIIEFLNPVITIICVGMAIIGLILIALRQEYYGLRLIIAAAIGLIIVYLVVPMILGLLP